MIKIKEEDLKEIIEQAHMAGQHDANGCDASYYDAMAYYQKNKLVKQPNKLYKMLTSIYSFFKRWNWGAFFVFFCVSMIGAMGNKNIVSFQDALLLGVIGGCVIGLPIAWLTMDNE